MNEKKIRYRSLTLLLLLSAILVGAVGAVVYYSMIMQPTVTINAAPVRFASGGSDWPTGSALGNNGTWVRLAFKAYPNATLIYEDPLNVSNTDTASHQFRLRHVSITPASGNVQVSNFTAVNFVVKNNAGAVQGTFNSTTTSNTWNTPSTTSWFTLPASTKWIIYVETKGAANAKLNTAASMQIAVDSQ
jgi:hypothetical protein